MGPIVLIVVLLIAAMVIVMLEILTPSFGLLGATAAACAAGAIYTAWGISSVFGIALLIAVVVATPLYLVFMVRWVPRTRLGQKLFLKRIVVDLGEGTPESDMLAHMIGKTGTAETLLRPSGAVRIDGKRVVAVAETGIINKGQTVTVIKAAGVNVIVRAAAEEATQS